MTSIADSDDRSKKWGKAKKRSTSPTPQVFPASRHRRGEGETVTDAIRGWAATGRMDVSKPTLAELRKAWKDKWCRCHGFQNSCPECALRVALDYANCPKCEDPEAPTLHRHPPAPAPSIMAQRAREAHIRLDEIIDDMDLTPSGMARSWRASLAPVRDFLSVLSKEAK